MLSNELVTWPLRLSGMSDFVKRLPLRVLQVGCGAFGIVHAAAWARLRPDVAVTVADIDAERREPLLQMPGVVRAVGDWEAGLADADVVDIVTPSPTHFDIACHALEAGCDVFIEKPVTDTARQAADIAARAAARGRLVQVGYFFRFHPLALRVRDLLRQGQVGEVHWIDADFTSLKRPRRDAGVILNDAVHFLDLVCWLMQQRPVSVTAMTGDRLGRGLEDRAALSLAFPGGAIARVSASCLVPGDEPDPVVPGAWSRKRIAITGDKGQIAADFMTGEIVTWPCRQVGRHDAGGTVWEPQFEPRQCERLPLPSTEDVVAAELAHFAACVRERRTPEAAIADAGVGMALLCEALHEAARHPARVALEVSA